MFCLPLSGREEETTTQTTTTTTTTIDPEAEVVPVFVIGVDEYAFVNDSYAAFKQDIQGRAFPFETKVGEQMRYELEKGRSFEVPCLNR